MIASMRESVKADIAMSESQFGLLTSVFLWVYGALSPLGGFIADRFSRKWVIVGSLGVWSVVTLLTGQARTFQEIFLLRALMGISEAFYLPAALALIASVHRGRTRSRAVGLHMSGVYAGAALGGVGGYIAEHFGWRQGFHWFGAGGVIYAILLIFFLRPDTTVQRDSEIPGIGTKNTVSALEALFALVGQPSFLYLVAYFSLFSLANWGINGWLPTYLREHFRLGEGKAGLSATAWIQVASFAGVLLGGAWSDSWVKRNPRGRLYVPMIGFCVGGPFLFFMASTDTLLSAVAGMIVYGLGRGFSDTSAMPILCQIVDPRYRATGYGLLNLFGTLVGGVMIYAGGVLRDAQVDLAMIFRLSAVGLIIAGLILLALKPRSELEGT